MKKKQKSIKIPSEEDYEKRIETDPFGSYTGVCTDADKYEEPIQDVDDL